MRKQIKSSGKQNHGTIKFSNVNNNFQNNALIAKQYVEK